MWGVLIAFGVVTGLVRFAMDEALDPFVKPALQKRHLAGLARRPAGGLTIDQAEDGAVLSRRLGERDLENRFRAIVKKLRVRRPTV